MNVNSSASVYSYVQNTSGDTTKTSRSRPATDSSATVVQSVSSSQSAISGQGLMMSRLFGHVSTLPKVQTQLTVTTQDMDASNFLTKNDLNALSNLYAQAQAQGNDLRYVDDIARDLGAYRKFGSVEANFNDGNVYDNSGRVQTVSFTDKDAATASRLLTTGNLSNSGLDPAFLKYELEPGYSFSHTASFDYLESIVNGTGSNVLSSDQQQTPQFATYVSQGLNNYVIHTASEVTFIIDEPDFTNKDGIFTVTETGKKHGFKLEGNVVVEDKATGLAASQSRNETATMLMNYFLNQSNTESPHVNKPASLFDFLFSSKPDS